MGVLKDCSCEDAFGVERDFQRNENPESRWANRIEQVFLSRR